MFYLLFLFIISLIVNILLFKLVNINLTKVEIYETWILEYKNKIEETYQALKFVDEKQIFEKDDEVGGVFLDIVTLLAKLNTRIQYDVNIKKETEKEN